jgi:hypothetical protein
MQMHHQSLTGRTLVTTLLISIVLWTATRTARAGEAGETLVSATILGEPPANLRTAEEAAPSEFSLTVTAEYFSKYIFRGVDTLPGSGVVDAELNVSAYGFIFDLWQIQGVQKNFRELFTSLSYEHDLGPITAGIGYTNDYVPQQAKQKLGFSDTQEVFANIFYKPVKYFSTTLSYYHDFDQINGGYLELICAGDLPVFGGRVNLQPYTTLGYNLGYNSDHDGLNNFDVGIDAPVHVTKRFSVSATAAVSVPLEAIRGSEDTKGWWGVRASYRY